MYIDVVELLKKSFFTDHNYYISGKFGDGLMLDAARFTCQSLNSSYVRMEGMGWDGWDAHAYVPHHDQSVTSGFMPISLTQSTLICSSETCSSWRSHAAMELGSLHDDFDREKTI